MSDSRQPPRRSAPSGSDPALRGLILVVVAVALGAILLAAGGRVGFDQDDKAVDIGDNGGDVTSTTEAGTTTSSVPVTVAPAQVAVVAANGAGISGLAGSTADFLAQQGYTNVTATDATAETALSVVYFAEGFDANAAAIGALFGLPASQVQPMPAEPLATEQPEGTAIVVVVGPDAEAVVSGAAAAGETTDTSGTDTSGTDTSGTDTSGTDTGGTDTSGTEGT